MRSLILLTMTRILLPLLLLFSVFLLLRGHYQPGGGFVGGLAAAAGFSLLAVATGAAKARMALRIDTVVLCGLGLLTAFLSACVGAVLYAEPLKSFWFEKPFPLLGSVGTPLMFDFGVYLAVVGAVLTIVFSLGLGDR